MPQRILRVKRINRIRRVHKAGSRTVTRAEFDAMIKLLNERGEIINELRREVYATSRDLETQIHQNRRELQTQFTRMAQLQQEVDALKKG
jgi:hypothetical protein